MLNILDAMLSKTERLISCFLKQNVLNVITNIFVRLSWSCNTVVSRAKGLKSGDNACNLFFYLSDCPGSCCVCVSCSVMSNSLQSQASLSMAFPRQEYWSRLPFPPPGDLPDPGTHPSLLHCRWILFFFCRWILYCLSHQGMLGLSSQILDLSVQHVGSSSLTRDRTQALGIGTAVS